MPSPAIAHPTGAISTGTLGTSTRGGDHDPGRDQRAAGDDERAADPAPAARSWSQDPITHVMAAAERARPPRVTLPSAARRR